MAAAAEAAAAAAWQVWQPASHSGSERGQSAWAALRQRWQHWQRWRQRRWVALAALAAVACAPHRGGVACMCAFKCLRCVAHGSVPGGAQGYCSGIALGACLRRRRWHGATVTYHLVISWAIAAAAAASGGSGGSGAGGSRLHPMRVQQLGALAAACAAAAAAAALVSTAAAAEAAAAMRCRRLGACGAAPHAQEYACMRLAQRVRVQQLPATRGAPAAAICLHWYTRGGMGAHAACAARSGSGCTRRAVHLRPRCRCTRPCWFTVALAAPDLVRICAAVSYAYGSAWSIYVIIIHAHAHVATRAPPPAAPRPRGTAECVG